MSPQVLFRLDLGFFLGIGQKWNRHFAVPTFRSLSLHHRLVMSLVRTLALAVLAPSDDEIQTSIW